MNFQINKISEKSLSRSPEKIKENKQLLKLIHKNDGKPNLSQKLLSGKKGRVIEIDLRTNNPPKSPNKSQLNLNPPMIYKSNVKKPIKVQLSTQKIDKNKVEATIKKSKATYDFVRGKFLATETGFLNQKETEKRKSWI